MTFEELYVVRDMCCSNMNCIYECPLCENDERLNGSVCSTLSGLLSAPQAKLTKETSDLLSSVLIDQFLHANNLFLMKILTVYGGARIKKIVAILTKTKIH